ncbi:hypothetical protein DW706_04475 [Bacteroides caccae]|jgi:DUF1680 family protein|nr:hypothetical protein DW706_04475 [Bacteroides caccae]
MWQKKGIALLTITFKTIYQVKRHIYRWCCLFGVLMINTLTGSACAESNGLYPNSALNAVEFNEVKIDDPFWNERIATIQEVTLPLLFQLAEKQGKIDNFRIVSGRKQGKLKLYNAPDSDVYKLLEAAGYSMSFLRNENLEAVCDSIIDDIVAAQDSTGYLHTQYMLEFSHPAAPSPDQKNVKTFGFGPSNRWKSLKNNWPFAYSQLYCAGHMMEAGVAYYRGTGKKALLDAAVRFADLICRVFDEEKIKTYADHPEVEIGLMKIYEVTGDVKYLRMADLMSRYVNFSRPVDINKVENSKPLHEQSCAFGHCVRTAYIYSGATDVIRATGAGDLTSGINRLWKSIVQGKMYLHGGTGNGTKAEQHGEMYDLPVAPTYSECCANIAQAQWNHRLNLLSADAKYAALVELEMFNSALSGISLDGTKFFYSNKINIDGQKRKNKHSGVRETYLFCCPSKLPGFITGIARWIYAKDEGGVYVNQFVGSHLRTRLKGKEVALRQLSDYAYQGKSEFRIEADARFALHIRLPQWLKKNHIVDSPYYYETGKENGYTLRLNGKEIKVPVSEKGYLTLERDWKKGDKIDVAFDMSVRRMYTDAKIKANRGRIALMRGPLLYCLEGVDNDFDILSMVLPAQNEVTAAYSESTLGGTMVLEGTGLVGDAKTHFKAVPYFMWENRGIAPMALLLVENPDKLYQEKEEEITDYNTNG